MVTDLNGNGSARKRDLDGLRGIAVLLVVFFHYVCRSGFFDNFGPQRLSLLVNSAWSGVDIFFVLSGFLIGGIIIDNGHAENFFRVFYLRRILRILPVASLTLAFCYFVLFPLDPSASSYADIPPYAYLLFINNFWTALGHQSYSPLGPMWSVAIEQQFYLLAPVFLILMRARLRNAMLIILIVISPLLRNLNTGFSAWDFTLFRLDGFAVGILVAALARHEPAIRACQHHRRTLNGVVAVIVAIALFFASSPRFSQLQRVAFGVSFNSLAAGAIVLLLQVSPGRGMSIALSRSWLVTIGRYSYFIYLMHMPLLTYAIFGYLGGPVALCLILAAGMTLLSALVSWRYLESRIISFGNKVSYITSLQRSSTPISIGIHSKEVQR